MAIIVPTITTADQNEFNTNLAEFQNFSKRVHIDASDGTFAPNQMVGLGDMHFPEGAIIDLHLMTATPSQYLPTIIPLKPHLCIFHAEVDEDLRPLADQLRAAGIQVGIAILKGTFPGKVKDTIALADHVMIFAGSLGEQGGTFDFLQIEKIPLLKAIKPDLEIGWDGGANLTNVRALAHSGVDVINVGSAITRAPDRSVMYQSLVAECDKKGVVI